MMQHKVVTMLQNAYQERNIGYPEKYIPTWLSPNKFHWKFIFSNW